MRVFRIDQFKEALQKNKQKNIYYVKVTSVLILYENRYVVEKKRELNENRKIIK